MKSLQELRENVADKVGIVTDIMQPHELTCIKVYAKQISAAFQPNVPDVIKGIEAELNKFGFSLGELDDEIPFDGEASEDFAVLVASTGEAVRNVYLTLTWFTMSSGQQYALRADGSELRLDVRLKVNEVDPNDYDSLYDEDADSVVEESLEIVDAPEVEFLDEAFQIKKTQRSLKVLQGKEGDLEFTVNTDGSISFNASGNFQVPKNKATEVMTKLMDHYIGLTEK